MKTIWNTGIVLIFLIFLGQLTIEIATSDNVYANGDFSDDPGVSIIPSAREKLIERDPTLENSILALVGLKVNHGDIIDSITPLFAQITPNLQIQKTIEGERIGGTGGQETLLEHQGYIITGIKLYRGYYFGRDEVIHIEVIWNRLTAKGIDIHDQKVSERLGSGRYATPYYVKKLLVKPNYYIFDIRSYTSSHTSGETFLNDLDIQSEKLLIDN